MLLWRIFVREKPDACHYTFTPPSLQFIPTQHPESLPCLHSESTVGKIHKQGLIESLGFRFDLEFKIIDLWQFFRIQCRILGGHIPHFSASFTLFRRSCTPSSCKFSLDVGSWVVTVYLFPNFTALPELFCPIHYRGEEPRYVIIISSQT